MLCTPGRKYSVDSLKLVGGSWPGVTVRTLESAASGRSYTPSTGLANTVKVCTTRRLEANCPTPDMPVLCSSRAPSMSTVNCCAPARSTVALPSEMDDDARSAGWTFARLITPSPKSLATSSSTTAETPTSKLTHDDVQFSRDEKKTNPAGEHRRRLLRRGRDRTNVRRNTSAVPIVGWSARLTRPGTMLWTSRSGTGAKGGAGGNAGGDGGGDGTQFAQVVTHGVQSVAHHPTWHCVCQSGNLLHHPGHCNGGGGAGGNVRAAGGNGSEGLTVHGVVAQGQPTLSAPTHACVAGFRT
eukprot:2149168-Prymnesium_polylepis.1